METCVTPKDVGWGGRKRWAVMSHNEATAASPGTGAQRAGAGRSQTGVPVPLQGPVLKCECPGNRGGHLGREESLQLRITLRGCHKDVGGRWLAHKKKTQIAPQSVSPIREPPQAS